MVVGFPLIKLAGVLMKQMGKPLATVAKQRAKDSHFFRTYICIPPAQFYHWCEVRMKMHVMGIGKSGDNSKIPKLNEQAAIELGANLLGEAVIFLVAVGVLAFEYSRQNRNEKYKEKTEKDYLIDLESKVQDLQFANEELDTRVRELTRTLYAIPIPSTNTQSIVTSLPVKADSSDKGKICNAIEDAQTKIITKGK